MKRIYILLLSILPLTVFSQYIESFNIADKGIISGTCTTNDPTSCASSDFSGVDWTIGGNLSGIDSEGFFTRTGYLLSEDLDEEACWVSPTLDISSSGSVSLSVTITIPSGTSWENSTQPGSIDYADVNYSIDGGSFTTIPNVSSCPGSAHTISASSCGSSLVGPLTFTPSISGLSGSTLDIHVCFDTNASSDDGHLEEVSVPEANVMILPIELITFSAIQEKSVVKLTWTTASEVNNEKFELEESQNGIAFQKIAEVMGNGTTLEEQKYTYDIENPKYGLSYFRLKQIDFDGRFEYSPVISTNFKGYDKQVGEFYPNPSESGFVNLTYVSNTDKDVLFSVFDLTGKLVTTQIQRVLKGNSISDLDFSDLSSGVYFVKIGETENTTYRKLIVEK